MTREQFLNLEIGDMVVITGHGNNKGKMGIVNQIGNNGAFLEPFQCEFQFYDAARKRTNKNGFYSFSYLTINYPKKPANKEFYVSEMFGGDGVSWSTNNFTENELKVIDRFLKEFNEKACGMNFEEVCIMDADDDEEEEDIKRAKEFMNMVVNGYDLDGDITPDGKFIIATSGADIDGDYIINKEEK